MVFIGTFILCMNVNAANTVTNVTSTITNAKTVSTAVDYTIKASTPFSGNGSVNITNTDNAVVIFANIKPTVVLSTWLSYIKINGADAKNGTNCQVKQYGKYGHGTIIMPYASDLHPLTCYTGQNYSGTSCNNYVIGSDGGFMKTLTSDNLNNQIRSFKLKRGYMVTFSVGTGGYGYSRCFIADDADLEFATLPACMDGKISSYRLFQWRDFGKAGLANNTSASDNGTLNSSWCYTFNVGSEINEDCEIVTHRVQKWWPSIADCGKLETPIMKTDNEPANSSDDSPASVDEILGYWEQAMRTGKRLCSPSDYDGDNTWLSDFFNKIDARGWRCDIYDIHCYWPVSSFSSLQSYYNKFKRPIMISEMMWGASWNSNGIFNSSTNTQADMLANGKTIVDKLNSWDYVESYAWWNGESTTASKVIENGLLTSFGEYYSQMATGLGYNKSYDVVPNAVYSTPTDLAAIYKSSTKQCVVNWTDKNGDMIDAMVLERSVPGNYTFEKLADIDLQDYSGSANEYSYNEQLDLDGEYRYRLAIYPAGETTPTYSNIATVQAGQAAGYVDVTDNYIKNWGFDMPKDYSMSNVNRGTYKTVSEWTLSQGSEWGASACFPIGSSKTLNSGAIPPKDLNDEVKGGVLAFSSGWSSECRYTQDVKLPAGSYKFTYCVYNSTNNTSFTNMTGVTVGTTDYFGSLTSIPNGQWRSETVDFTLTSEETVTFSVGYKGSNTTTTSNALLRFDYVSLARYDDGTVIPEKEEKTFTPGEDITDQFDKEGFSAGKYTGSSDGVTGCEVFNWGASLDLGSPIGQTVSLPNGYYTIELYAMASSTSGRDNTSNVIDPDGATGYVTVHANDQKQDVPTYNRTGFDTFDQYKFLCVHVADGKLTVELDMDKTGPNWLVMQIKKATYLGKVLGDINGDGQITITDVPHLINILKGNTKGYDGIGDTDGNNVLNVEDAKALVNKLKVQE